jgi:hypothetical protein
MPRPITPRTPAPAPASFEIRVKTDALLDLFDLPTLAQIDEVEAWDIPYPSMEELVNNTICLGLSYNFDEDGVPIVDEVLDRKDTVLPEEALEDLQRATVEALVVGTQNRYYKEVMSTLEGCLNEAGNGQYDYDYSTSEGGLANAHGRAEGIIDVTVRGETTVLTLSTDIVHMINQCIAGRGDFEIPEDDFTPLGDAGVASAYAKDHLMALGDYWEIFGASTPRPDTSNLEDFDKNHFKDLVAEIEQQYGLKIWNCR